ncbi:MAG: hypothetical protein WDW36_002150 [Sanguina aurantia]
MQLFVRCATAGVGTLTVECQPGESVGLLLERLTRKSPSLGHSHELRLSFGGRQLHEDALVQQAPLSGIRITPASTLHLSGRLRGGGGDGGSTGAESRSCYLEMYLGKRHDKVNPAEELAAKWTRCHLTGEPLAHPVVIDDLGNLYNKDAVVHALLHKTMPPSLRHISALRHVAQLQLVPNPAAETRQRAAAASAAAAAAAGSSSSASATAKASASATPPTNLIGSMGPSNDADFICPVSGVDFNGRYRFVVFRPTGAVVSEKALKEVPTVVKELFGRAWQEEDLVHINPTGEALERLQVRVAVRMATESEKKKGRKAKSASAAGPPSGEESAAAAVGPVPGVDINGGQRGAKRASEPAGVAANGKGVVGKKVKPSHGAPAAAAAAGRAIDKNQGPVGSTKAIYASLFTSTNKSQPTDRETFCCRSMSSRYGL